MDIKCFVMKNPLCHILNSQADYRFLTQLSRTNRPFSTHNFIFPLHICFWFLLKAHKTLTTKKHYCYPQIRNHIIQHFKKCFTHVGKTKNISYIVQILKIEQLEISKINYDHKTVTKFYRLDFSTLWIIPQPERF